MASRRAAQLILELAGGTPGAATNVSTRKEKPISIQLSPARVHRVTGLSVPSATITKILKQSGIGLTKKGSGWACRIPSHRKDLVTDVDLIEEVSRMIGYNAIPETLPRLNPGVIPPSMRATNTEPLVDLMKGLGFNETMTTSFCNAQVAGQFGFSEQQLVPLLNPLSQEESVMRPLTLITLLSAIQRNIHFQRDSALLFEIGSEYERLKDDKTSERIVLAVAAYGKFRPASWQGKEEDVTFYDLKGVLESIGKHVPGKLDFMSPPSKPFLHPYQGFDITIGGQKAGWGGLLHPALGASFDFKLPCVVAEINIKKLLSLIEQQRFSPIPKFTPIERDIAILVSNETPWERLKSVVTKAGSPLVQSVTPFDIFTGGTLPTNHKSVAFRVTLLNPDQTLSDNEINSTVDRVKASLKDHCGAQLR